MMKYNIFRIINVQFMQKRYFKKVQSRVRFAPSPTGINFFTKYNQYIQ